MRTDMHSVVAIGHWALSSSVTSHTALPMRYCVCEFYIDLSASL